MLLRSSRQKALVALIHDTFMAALSFVLALYLRLGGEEFSQTDSYLLPGVALFTLTALITFAGFKLYRRSWRYIATQDLRIITEAVTLAVLLFLPVMFLYNRLEDMPRSLIFINWLVLMVLLCAPRFAYRMLKEGSLGTANSTTIPANQKIAVLLVGANQHTEQFLRETVDNPHANYRIVGIIDEDAGMRGQYIRSVKVFGGLDGLEKTLDKLQAKGKPVQKIIIAPDMLDGPEVRTILDSAEARGLTVSRLPRLTDFTQTGSGTIPLRPIALEDLLGRPQRTLDREAIAAMIRGNKILVTGAGGTIGSELVRQIAGYGPASITLLDNAEYNLYAIDMELNETFPDLPRHAIIADVRDADNLTRILKEERPEVVFHAAALKHVPMSEHNRSEAILTNVFGSKNIADACIAAEVHTMVMISTDKAVNPTNVMGASKRLAESYVQALGNSTKTGNTRFVTIRFGNVLGSTGSVIPLFKRQIEAGGPITITHPDITRYFMTVREAVELVLQSATIAHDLPTGDSRIYVLDMGEPVLIQDLAEQLIRLAGRVPHSDITITYTGLRPGEKLFEELFYGEEAPIPTDHAGIMLATTRSLSLDAIRAQLETLYAVAIRREDATIADTITSILPEYVEN